jgi:hypothetical protein
VFGRITLSILAYALELGPQEDALKDDQYKQFYLTVQLALVQIKLL